MRLISVQRGVRRTEGADGAVDPMHRRFTSAIRKQPVQAPVRCTTMGIEGDEVADRRHHGGPDQALLAYAADHYPRWRAEWDRPGLAFGAFGENLTVEAAREDDVCLGDRWAINGVRLEVSAAREPCGTLARRHQVADLVKVIRRNGRGGWYLRVLEEGEIEPGLQVNLVARPHPEWTVRRALGVMVAGSPEERRALLDCPAIASRWRERLSR